MFNLKSHMSRSKFMSYLRLGGEIGWKYVRSKSCGAKFLAPRPCSILLSFCLNTGRKKSHFMDLTLDQTDYVVPGPHQTKALRCLHQEIDSKGLVKGKVSFRPVNTGQGSHLPFGPDSFSIVWGSPHLLHNESITFPALPVPMYTPWSRGVIMVKCLT